LKLKELVAPEVTEAAWEVQRLRGGCGGFEVEELVAEVQGFRRLRRFRVLRESCIGLGI
jgi:hypothetical protein